jgi:competence protein ComEC
MHRSLIPFWKFIPAFRPLVAFMVGIIAARYASLSPLLVVGIGSLAMLCYWVFNWLANSFTKHKLAVINGSLLLLCFASLGYLAFHRHKMQHDQKWYGHFYKDSVAIVITIQEPLVAKEKTYKAVGEIVQVSTANGVVPTKGTILLYFKKEAVAPNLDYGDCFLTTASLSALQPASNPGAFDYRQFAAFQGVHHQLFLQSSQYRLVSMHQTNWLSSFKHWVRQQVKVAIQKNIPGKAEQAVAEALLLGIRDDLDKELVQAYSNTGVVHIIAISGLHLGMIYGLLLWLFGFSKNQQVKKWIAPLVILLTLWAFSFLAGMAPSILRSAIMFSMLVLGNRFQKLGNHYNFLALSAFIILIMDPFAVWDVGFQLSYSAVLSIMLFQKSVRNWFFFRNKWLQKIWDLNAITIAAQVVTLPIVIFHFHQFPNYFILANLVVVPLSGLVLYGELVFLLLLPFDWLAQKFGWLLGACIRLMNHFIAWVNGLPAAVTEGLQLSLLQSCLLMVVLMMCCFAFMRRQSKMLLSALELGLLFVVLQSFEVLTKRQQKLLIVYHLPQHSAIDLVAGNQYAFLGDSMLQADGFLRNFHIKPTRTYFRFHHWQQSLVQSAINLPLHCFDGKKIMLINQSIRLKELAIPQKIDLLVLGGKQPVYLRNLLKTIWPTQIVVDGSATDKNIRYWQKDAAAANIPLHVVKSDGAYVQSW